MTNVSFSIQKLGKIKKIPKKVKKWRLQNSQNWTRLTDYPQTFWGWSMNPRPTFDTPMTDPTHHQRNLERLTFPYFPWANPFKFLHFSNISVEIYNQTWFSACRHSTWPISTNLEQKTHSTPLDLYRLVNISRSNRPLWLFSKFDAAMLKSF